MHVSRKQRRVVSVRRRIGVTAALAAYLIATVGVPMPAGAAKRHGTPFPCQSHACGCMSSGDCWENCCCHSPEQMLDWAHEHDVEPPARFLAKVREAESRRLAGSTATPAAKTSCCSQRSKQHSHNTCDAECDEHDSPAGVTFIVGSMARQCRGLADMWCTSGAALPFPSALCWQFQWDLVEWLPLETAGSLIDLSSPPVPPPRV